MNSSAVGVDNYWNEYPADEWSDAIVAAMKLGGVDKIFFVSGSESAFLQEATAKAKVLGTPAPELITMIHETVALNAALGGQVDMIIITAASVMPHVKQGRLRALAVASPKPSALAPGGALPRPA